jgi:hypothetical protein
MANKIQLRRDTTANWENVNPILADGEPGLDITTNQVKYGDGANVWANLSYASGGGGVTFDANGMLVLTGNLWVGTWNDNDSVLWAPDTSEYVGLWYGGERDPEANYGPNVSITVGNEPIDDNLLGGWANGLQINLDVDDKNWHFAADGNLTFPDSTTQSTAFNITKFGEGFSLNGADKIVTNKLYSTNASSPTQHYRLELDTNGVVVLPDQSIINGSTIRGIYGTGGLNYSGITIGPNVSYQEESWMYVDHSGAYIATKYNTDQKLWQFDNTGNLTLPAGGEIHSSAGTGNVVVQSNDGATAYNWTFETSGALILPTVSGNEGAEIDFTKAPNSTLSGSSVVVDQYVDRLRFFEGGGTSRGAYIDLKQAAAGVGTLLNNRVSGFVNAGAFVTMDLLKATVTTTSNRGLSLAATTGSFVIYIAGTYAKTSTTGGAMAEVTLTTTPEASMFNWDFGNAGDSSTYIITDTTNNRSYRITLQIGYLYNNNMISIERLI